ncbi:MAG: pelota family protein [Candidatus Micrarchaeota archaeon]|nr:pelota family protein [Candidatus Micrarchaeota archaeon]
MRLISFQEGTGVLKVRVDTLDDLWTIERITFPNDIVKSESMRRFKGHEGDVGEMKEVVITLRVEKAELDKNAVRLRFLGKIVEGRPLEYVRLNSYHTLNIAPGDILQVIKPKWHKYIVDVVRNAVAESRKPRLGLVAMDDEKALPAYMLGFGLKFMNEVYSGLSKRMSNKEFAEQKANYFKKLFDLINGMEVDTVIIAGPGFTKDEFKAHLEAKELLKKTEKKLIFESVSYAERSGIYELVKSERVANILRSERIRAEFKLMGEFLNNLSTGRSAYGAENVERAMAEFNSDVILVNDSMLNDAAIQRLLEKAEERKIKIEIFNSGDEVGTQLHGFKDIASIGA